MSDDTDLLEVADADVQELFFERGWTDGLPIVPPTPDRVAAMLAAGGVEPGVLIERGAQHDMTPGSDGRLPTVPGPDDIALVTAGGAGAGWSAYIPAWAPVLHSRSVTKRVRPVGEALPDCGPDSCAVPFPNADPEATR